MKNVHDYSVQFHLKFLKISEILFNGWNSSKNKIEKLEDPSNVNINLKLINLFIYTDFDI